MGKFNTLTSNIPLNAFSKGSSYGQAKIFHLNHRDEKPPQILSSSIEANFLLVSTNSRIIFFPLQEDKPKFIATMDLKVFTSILQMLQKSTACF